MSAVPSVPSTLVPVVVDTSTLTIRPWPDDTLDAVGHDPRSVYVERFWLGILGPSTTWLMRRLATGLEDNPDGFDLPLESTARALGLRYNGGRSSPFMRALTRCCQFGFAQPHDQGVLAVRRKLPPLSRRQVLRLPPDLRKEHSAWEATLYPSAHERLERRSRQLALSLLELGEDRESTERQLLRWRFHPSLAHDASVWAWARHHDRDAQLDSDDVSCS